MNVISLVIDRLHAGYLGAYGNTWIGTPSIDRLASQATVFDQMLIDTPCLNKIYRSYWQGRHALCAEGSGPVVPPFASLLRDAGIHSALFTDEPTIAADRVSGEFDELVNINSSQSSQLAEVIEETHLGTCFAEIIDWLQSPRSPFLLWCHLGSMGTTWDAPLEFRQRYCEPGDPAALEIAATPNIVLPEDYDPDQLLGITQAYAGQVSLLDLCLGVLLDFLAESPVGKETLLVLTSPRGFPLGEHGRVGTSQEALYGEMIHVPLLVRMPDGTGAAERSGALIEPADLWATMADYFQLANLPVSPTAASLLPLVRDETPPCRDRLCVTNGTGEYGLRTPAWYLRVAENQELFAKPDDRWEANDVSGRCHEVVEELAQKIEEFDETVQGGTKAEFTPLSDILLNGME